MIFLIICVAINPLNPLYWSHLKRKSHHYSLESRLAAAQEILKTLRINMTHNYIYTAHSPLDNHLDSVQKEMILMGSPKIRVLDSGDFYIALEGVHRLNSAKNLGITPILEILKGDDIISDHDFEDLPKEATCDEIACYVIAGRESIYFEELEIL
jgi:hypothetical protein